MIDEILQRAFAAGLSDLEIITYFMVSVAAGVYLVAVVLGVIIRAFTK